MKKHELNKEWKTPTKEPTITEILKNPKKYPNYKIKIFSGGKQMKKCLAQIGLQDDLCQENSPCPYHELNPKWLKGEIVECQTSDGTYHIEENLTVDKNMVNSNEEKCCENCYGLIGRPHFCCRDNYCPCHLPKEEHDKYNCEECQANMSDNYNKESKEEVNYVDSLTPEERKEQYNMETTISTATSIPKDTTTIWEKDIYKYGEKLFQHKLNKAPRNFYYKILKQFIREVVKEEREKFLSILDDDSCECDNCHRTRDYFKNSAKELNRFKQKNIETGRKQERERIIKEIEKVEYEVEKGLYQQDFVYKKDIKNLIENK